MKKYDSLDLMKFILSLFVVALHVQPIRGGYEGLRLICRLAVPLFFITSGFFYFSKLKTLALIDWSNYLRKYINRGLRLYLSWMIILLPFTIYYRQWFRMGFGQMLKSFVTNFLFGSTFIASWYLMALLIGIATLTIASEKLSNRVLFALSLTVYCICCAWSGYGKLIGLPVSSGWPQIYNSFPVSLIWLMIGKIIADGNIMLPSIRSKGILIVVSTALYITEYTVCIRYDLANNTDALVTMIPICFVLFVVVKDVNISLGSKARLLRQISTVSYCLHASVGVVLGVGFSLLFHANMSSGWWMIVRYLSTVAICVIVTILIRKLERKTKIAKWLY